MENIRTYFDGAIRYDTDGKTTIATLPSFEMDLSKEVEDLFTKYLVSMGVAPKTAAESAFQLTTSFIIEMINKQQWPNNIRGIAKCNFDGGEVYDEQIGCELARDRLMSKISWKRYKVIENGWSYIVKNRSIFRDYMTKVFRTSRAYDRDIARLEDRIG